MNSPESKLNNFFRLSFCLIFAIFFHLPTPWSSSIYLSMQIVLHVLTDFLLAIKWPYSDCMTSRRPLYVCPSRAHSQSPFHTNSIHILTFSLQVGRSSLCLQIFQSIDLPIFFISLFYARAVILLLGTFFNVTLHSFVLKIYLAANVS